ncbi:MAG: hypothetical protein ACK6DQ_11505, partial [Planctomycetota bacterium]
MILDRSSKSRCLFLAVCFSFLSWHPAAANENDPADIPAEPKSPAEWFGQTIRSSNWNSPADELAGFHVPRG